MIIQCEDDIIEYFKTFNINNIIINEINNYLDGKDITYKYYYLKCKIDDSGHAIGGMIINNKDLIISNAGAGIQYHPQKINNNIRYCKPYIKISNIDINLFKYHKNNIYNSIEEFYVNTVFSLSNEDLSNYEYIDYWYPAQLSGNCSYLSHLLIFFYYIMDKYKIDFK